MCPTVSLIPMFSVLATPLRHSFCPRCVCIIKMKEDKEMKKYTVRAPHKNKSGTWRGLYSIKVGDKVIRKSCGSFKTRTEAKKQTEELVADLIRKETNQLVDSKLNVAEFVDQFWKDQRIKELVNSDHIQAFEKMMKITGFDQTILQSVNKTSLRRFWLEVEDILYTRDKSISFKSKLKSNMNSMLNYAVRLSFLEDNENYNIKSDSARAIKKNKAENSTDIWEKAQKIWTEDQIKEYLPLFKNLPQRPKYVDAIMWWAFFNIGIFTGLRRGEITGLKFSDFDREKRILTVNRSVRMHPQKREITTSVPKASSFGYINYSSELDEVLDALEMYHQVKGTLDNEYLFQYKLGGVLDPNYWSRMFTRVQIKAGVPEDEVLPSVHWIRHTHLSLLANKGFSLAEIQRRARHSDPRTTAKFYVHIVDERDKDMAESFSLIGGE